MDYRPYEPEAEDSPNRDCLRRIFSYYHSNLFRLGFALLPVVLLSYFCIDGVQRYSREIYHQGGIGRPVVTLPFAVEMIGLKLLTFVIPALLYGLVTAGITKMIGMEREGTVVGMDSALNSARDQGWKFAIVSVLQATATSGVAFLSLVLAFPVFSHLTFKYGMAFDYLILASGLAVLTRFLLCVPVIAEEKLGVWAALGRSQNLAAELTPTLIVVSIHATVAAYLGAKIPYWAFNFVISKIELPYWSGWIPYVLSFVLVAWAEPVLAIGCAEVYRTAVERENMKAMAASQ